MQIVYLDQNKWIDLARAEFGKNRAVELQDVLVFLRRSRELRQACFPLSLTHYMETIKIGKLERRLRLAVFMRQFSGGITMANPTEILRYEIDVALWQRFPSRGRVDRVKSLALLGEGYWHADGCPDSKPTLPVPDPETLHPKVRPMLSPLLRSLDEALELGVLSGSAILTGEVVPRADFSQEETSFKGDLSGLHRLASLDPRTQEDVLYLLCLRDNLPPIARGLDRLGIPAFEFEAFEFDDWKRLIDDLPTQRIVMHLLRQWIKNTALKPKHSDFYDWMSLMAAAAYCDVVVTEKQSADLLNRDGSQKRAKVITDLRQLSVILTDASR